MKIRKEQVTNSPFSYVSTHQDGGFVFQLPTCSQSSESLPCFFERSRHLHPKKGMLLDE